jgi:hypothetical protein
MNQKNKIRGKLNRPWAYVLKKGKTKREGDQGIPPHASQG